MTIGNANRPLPVLGRGRFYVAIGKTECVAGRIARSPQRGYADVMKETHRKPKIHSTTIVAVKRGNEVAIGGDGQVTLEHTVLKHSGKKVRRLYQNRVLAGFAGSVADAQSLADRFETKLESCSGNLTRAAIEFAKDWRTDRVLRRLEAMMIVTDGERVYILSGDGNVVEPDDGVAAIGSGGMYAAAAAKALLHKTELSPREIVVEAMGIAADICIYTNDRLTLDSLP